MFIVSRILWKRPANFRLCNIQPSIGQRDSWIGRSNIRVPEGELIRFLSVNSSSTSDFSFLCCNMSNPLFSDSYLDFCLRNSTSFLSTSYNDTPIFDNTTFALIGYTAMLPTHLKYNHRFSLLSKSFEMLEMTKPADGFWAPEWWLMSTWLVGF